MCELPSEYRTYLRCSPLLCGVDALSRILHLLACMTYGGMSFHESLNNMAREQSSRFTHPDQSIPHPVHDSEHSSEGIQNIENMIWMRWVFFILGTLPPALKLLSVEGIPWSRTWVILFLSSWIVNEILAFLVWFKPLSRRSTAQLESWPGFEPRRQESRLDRLRRWIYHLKRSLGLSALIIQLILMSEVVRSIYHKSPDDNFHPGIGNRGTLVLIVLTVIALGPNRLLSLSLSEVYNIEWIGKALSWLNGLVFLISNYYDFWALIWMIAVLVIASPLVTAMNVFWGLMIDFDNPRIHNFGRNLLLLQQSTTGRGLVVQSGVCLALLFSAATLAFCALAYCYLVDLENTVTPTWSGVFG